MPDLTLEKRGKVYWIIGLPDPTCPECGPYSTKAEAEDDQRGLVRYFRHRDNPTWWTTNPPIKEGV